MDTFDPDDDFPYVELAEPTSSDLRSGLHAVEGDGAVELLASITQDLPGGGESREGQRVMVRSIAEAITKRRHLVVEAGTGVGKSLAYLVPAALAGGRVVIATATKNLQDQLASKDAPLVAAHAPGMSVAVLKGKSNYLCKLRANELGGGNQLSFDDGGELPTSVTGQLRQVLDWSENSLSGDKDELGFEVDSRAWRQVSVTPQECLGRQKCPVGHICFHERAKEIAASSDVIIVNSHLYGAHLAAGGTILPEHDMVIFDEAHEMLDTFASVLGTSLNATRFRAVAAMARPVLNPVEHLHLDQVLTTADRLAAALEIQFAEGVTSGISLEVEAQLAEGAAALSVVTEKIRTQLTDNAVDENRRLQVLGPAVHLTNDLLRLSKAGSDELLWLTKSEREVTIELSLIDVGPRLRDELWASTTGILTSATIPDNLIRDLGLSGDADFIQVESPFDYPTNAMLYVPENFPDRVDAGAEAAIIEELASLITAAGGRTLALFTNRSVMKRVAEAVGERILTPILVQDTLSRNALIERFRSEESSSLFAVTSYWQGIDVPGDSLRLVTIDRLPFQRPDDPLSIARRERAGEDAFHQVDLPRAAMLLSQGVGRLIRSTTDRGVVAVFDTRLATKNYRHRMIKRLPPMRRTRLRSEVEEFLQELDS